MQSIRQHRLPLVSLILVAVLLTLVGLVNALPVPVGNLNLNSSDSAMAYEIFHDHNGVLWISDFGVGEIWQVDPEGEYIIYGGLGGVSDAKVDNNGHVWWIDNKNDRLGHLVPNGSDTEAETWPLTGNVSNTLGLAIDPNGDIWTTDDWAPTVIHFQPGANPGEGKMCNYTIPDDGASLYIVADAGRLWLGDWPNNRILALDPKENIFHIWQLPDAHRSKLKGIAVDEDHNIWWADEGQNILGRLRPQYNTVTTYTLPNSQFGPQAISADGNRIWTNSGRLDFFARLNPANIYIEPATVTTDTAEAFPVCTETMNSSELSITVSDPQQFFWGGGFYERISSAEANVWLVYQIFTTENLPGKAWGIVAAGEYVYIVDQGRQKLTRLRACSELTLTHKGKGKDPLESAASSELCPNGEYLAGEEVALTAQPAAGYGVLRWSGTDNDKSRNLTNKLTMPGKNHTASVEYGSSTFLPLAIRH